ncbi:AHH domain-containing protein [Stigmatella sp. ncwal1]|uniref:AHH domain-containing protein n=1 Tax=Stigmatella ashevillensis TaxID=2995309 RepID=A0ABT5DEE0_9BACT|nr:AHH domain-containing protein [Stigmatella ashevillena]MDC0712016.1 AHH domain-containing protein [Stigmatella ashevillena]
MRMQLGVLPLLLSVLAGCGTSGRVVRLEVGQDEIVVLAPRSPVERVELDEHEFEEAVRELVQDVRPSSNPLREARHLLGVPARNGMYLYEGSSRRLLPVSDDEDADGLRLLASSSDEKVTRAYSRWCERKGQSEDCLRLLKEGPLLASDGKYALATAIAMGSVWPETARALKNMADPQALLATVTASISMYMLLWTLPEPVSKGIAALLTATVIAYLGVDTVWRLLDGWVVLVRKVDQATTFEQLSEAGEQYGEVLGENAARIFIMLATAAIGSTAGLGTKALGLPGSAQAALAVEAQAGYQYAAISSVKSVVMTSEGFTLALAPNALAMSGRGMGSGHQRRRRHHLATDKNSVSTARGGPWTPKFEKIFAKAGMELKDPENVVPIKGHRGPHPQEYHERVHERLYDATRHCRKVSECKEALTAALRRLAKEVMTEGSELNQLVTKSSQP